MGRLVIMLTDSGMYNMLAKLVEVAVRDARKGDAEAIDFLWIAAPARAELEGLPAIATEDSSDVGDDTVRAA